MPVHPYCTLHDRPLEWCQDLADCRITMLEQQIAGLQHYISDLFAASCAETQQRLGGIFAKRARGDDAAS